jgi:Arabinose efflux permease
MEIEDYDHKTEEGQREETFDSNEVERKTRKKVFLIMILINALLNYDTGVIPASLIQLEEEMGMSYQQEAAVGSLIYIGVCSASLIVSITFQRYSASKVIILMLTINCFFCLLFSFSYNIAIMYIARIGMGFTQAFCVIYAPVWTNEFSPRNQCTR